MINKSCAKLGEQTFSSVKLVFNDLYIDLTFKEKRNTQHFTCYKKKYLKNCLEKMS